MAPFSWTCPYCNRDTTINDTYATDHFDLRIQNAEGAFRFITVFIVCPNRSCRKFTLKITKHEFTFNPSGPDRVGDVLQSWTLVPPSEAKVFPDYVPKPIRDDYLEACVIRDLSPKASATLSRRCLQGMIRHFWGIKKGRLIEEIEALKDKTDALTWEAIDTVRKIGNIGAHMEKDIDVIVDVEPNEAQLLIGLIETLVEDWYVGKHDKEERLKAIAALSAKKEVSTSMVRAEIVAPE